MAEVIYKSTIRNIGISDAGVLGATLAVLYFSRFGSNPQSFEVEDQGLLRFDLPIWAEVMLMYAIWFTVLWVNGSRDYRVLGTDSQEYKRVAMSGLLVPVFFAFAALLFKVDVPRLFIGSSIIIGSSVLLLNRWLWRQWIILQRKRGSLLSKVAILGPKNQIELLAKKLEANKADGYVPGLLIADSESALSEGSKSLTPMVSYQKKVLPQLEDFECNTLMVIGSRKITEQEVKALAWQLEGTGIDLVIAPPLKDIAVTRLAVRPVAGTPVFVVQVPKFQGYRHFLKYIFDLVAGCLALFVTLPIVLVFAILIKIEDCGPIFYRQLRVGLNGREFKMFKLRSMRVGADLDHARLLFEANTSPNVVMYKNAKDPRVTRIGRYMRRWSIDELPQFINVLAGEMSMVGPRPPMPIEVEGYEEHAHRRLLVKPGITGLWQVSGKNSLTWEETIALDLNYVENWSLVGDLLLIMKTFTAVIASANSVASELKDPSN
jgi:exopolysaccharide biosynthesis polyprenyl glycosylphosphotransferase